MTQSPASGAVAVLVIDDQEDARELMRRAFERAGFAVDTARNGAEGLKRFRERAFDLVVTDIMMPEMDGYEVIRAVRAERPDTPIIAVSGVEDWAMLRRMAVGLGANAALQIPAPAAVLLQTAQRVLTAA